MIKLPIIKIPGLLLGHNNEWKIECGPSGPRRLGPFSLCCSIWLAESALPSPSCVWPPQPWLIDWKRRRAKWTSLCDWRRDSAVVQGQTPVHPWVIWLGKWRRYEWSYVCYRHNADTVTKAICQTTSWRQPMITYVHRRFGRYTDLLSADMKAYRFLHCDINLRLGCVLYSMAYYIRSFTVSAIWDRAITLYQIKWPRPFWGKLLAHPLGFSKRKLCTKFKVSSSSSFEDMFDCMPKSLGVTWPRPLPFSRKLFEHPFGFPQMKLYTKYKVSG